MTLKIKKNERERNAYFYMASFSCKEEATRWRSFGARKIGVLILNQQNCFYIYCMENGRHQNVPSGQHLRNSATQSGSQAFDRKSQVL